MLIYIVENVNRLYGVFVSFHRQIGVVIEQKNTSFSKWILLIFIRIYWFDLQKKFSWWILDKKVFVFRVKLKSHYNDGGTIV